MKRTIVRAYRRPAKAGAQGKRLAWNRGRAPQPLPLGSRFRGNDGRLSDPYGILFEILSVFEFDGGCSRIRTYGPLIKSFQSGVSASFHLSDSMYINALASPICCGPLLRLEFW